MRVLRAQEDSPFLQWWVPVATVYGKPGLKIAQKLKQKGRSDSTIIYSGIIIKYFLKYLKSQE